MLRPGSFISATLLTVFLANSPVTHAFEGFANLFPNNPQIEFCYGFAMVGMDSVINSRIGVPPQDVVALARVSQGPTEHYSHEILKTMLNAYFWDGTPHSYAINVFYQCSQRMVNHSASAKTAIPFQ